MRWLTSKPSSSIHQRLARWLWLAGALVILAICLVGYYLRRQEVLEDLSSQANSLSRLYSERVESELLLTQAVTSILSLALEEETLDAEREKSFFTQLLEKNEMLYGCGVALEPDVLASLSSAYFYRERSGISRVTLDPSRYREQNWYNRSEARWSLESLPKKLPGTGVTLSYTVPLHQNGRFVGVVRCDLPEESLFNEIASLRLDGKGYSYLATSDGTVLISSKPRLKSIPSDWLEDEDSAREKLTRREISGSAVWVLTTSLGDTGVSLGLVYPHSEVQKRVGFLVAGFILFALVAFTLLYRTIVTVTRMFMNPLERLTEATERVGKGDLAATISPLPEERELRIVAIAFNTMVERLRDKIHQLQVTREAKELLSGELKAGQDIQKSYLPPPRSFPGMEMAAYSEPAREVGGDFYDFFELDNGTVVFALGDVSGKGLAAALHMVCLRTILRAVKERWTGPATALTEVNRLFLSRAEELDGFFATIFLGCLESTTGRLVYSNAGHDPPYLVSSKGQSNELTLTGDIPLGVLPDYHYSEQSRDLEADDLLVLFSDGLPEARKLHSEEQYSEDRLFQTIRTVRAKTPMEICNILLREVDEHSEGHRADDRTVLVVQRKV